MKIFCLEDEIGVSPRNAIKTVLEAAGHVLVIATNAEMGKALYPSQQPYDMLLLDHDMEGHYEDSAHPNTGMNFCKWLVEHPQAGEGDDPEVWIHSHNPDGSKNMASLLHAHGFKVYRHSFDASYVEALKNLPKERAA